jgi:hypothetical protein
MLACRACRVALTAASGCSLCDVVRRNLVVVGEHDEDRPSLSGVGNEIVNELRAQLRHIRGMLKADPDSNKGTARLIAIANSTAKVIESVRKLQVDGTKAVEAMAFAERAALFVTWYADLPPAYRATMREKMAEHEVAISAPVPASVVLS